MTTFLFKASCQPPNYCGCHGQPKARLINGEIEAESAQSAWNKGKEIAREYIKNNFPLSTTQAWEINCFVVEKSKPKSLEIEHVEIVRYS